MWRTVLAVVVGLLAWAAIATLLNFGLRLALPGYVAAEQSLDFTLGMKIGRLALATVTSLATGALVALVAPRSRWAPWIVGLIALALFLPEHVRLWARLPIWYHLSFLLPLAPLVVLGARLRRAG